MNVAENLSSTNLTNVPSTNEKTECGRCEAERRRGDAILTDLQNAQADVIAKNRQIGRLKADLAEVHEADVDQDEVVGLLSLWRTQHKEGSKRFSIALDTDRATTVRRWVKRKGAERCRRVILGGLEDAWAMGRAPKCHGRQFNDIKHLFADEERFNHFEELFLKAETPALDAPPSITRRREQSVFESPPVTKVLSSLHAAGCEPVPSRANPDYWMARCPAHDDRSPSLAVTRKPDGMMLLHCFASCDTEDILRELRLEWRDLWDGCERDYNCIDSVYREVEPEMPPHLVLAMMQLVENRDVPADLRREMVQRLEREGRNVERQAA